MKNDISKLYAIRNNYAKALKKALNKQPRGIPMYLDLHKEKYFNLLTGCFGGKNNLKKQFPNLNTILQLSKNEAPQYNETFIGYCDGAIISFLISTMENFMLLVMSILHAKHTNFSCRFIL